MFIFIRIGGGQFVVGPPWDFDAWTFGLYGTSHYYCTKTSLYFEYLFKDPFFVNRMKEKWSKYKELWLKVIPDYIDDQYKYIENAAKRNEWLWPEFYSPNENYSKMSYEECVQDMKQAFKTQIEWMDNSINNNYFKDWWDENDWPPSHR